MQRLEAYNPPKKGAIFKYAKRCMKKKKKYCSLCHVTYSSLFLNFIRQAISFSSTEASFSSFPRQTVFYIHYLTENFPFKFTYIHTYKPTNSAILHKKPWLRDKEISW